MLKYEVLVDLKLMLWPILVVRLFDSCPIGKGELGCSHNGNTRGRFQVLGNADELHRWQKETFTRGTKVTYWKFSCLILVAQNWQQLICARLSAGKHEVKVVREKLNVQNLQEPRSGPKYSMVDKQTEP